MSPNKVMCGAQLEGPDERCELIATQFQCVRLLDGRIRLHAGCNNHKYASGSFMKVESISCQEYLALKVLVE